MRVPCPAMSVVWQVNYGRRTLERIYQLHTGAINQLALHEGFCVTASDDRFLRIWPLDFSDFLLEVQATHRSLQPCVCVCVCVCVRAMSCQSLPKNSEAL